MHRYVCISIHACSPVVAEVVVPQSLHVEYAEREKEYGILFILSLFVNTCTLNMYVSMSYTGFIRRNT